MRKHTIILLFFCLCLTVTACCQRERCPFPKGGATVELPGQSEVYHGVLPCASCPGIDTWLLLYKDGDGRYFRMVESYLEEKDAVFFSEGRVMEKGDSIIELEKGEATLRYQVCGNQLYLQGDVTATGSGREDPGSTDYTLYRMPAPLKQ